MSSNSILVFDLETVRDQELMRRIPWDEEKKGFPPPAYHEIFCISYFIFDWVENVIEEYGTLRQRHPSFFRESHVIERFREIARKCDAKIVTWNGLRFDLPVLEARSMHHGMNMRWYSGRQDSQYETRPKTKYKSRHDHTWQHDLKDEISFYGMADTMSMDLVAKLIGLPGKMETDGSMVQEMYESGEYEKIGLYCETDVLQLLFIWLRWAHTTGTITGKMYVERVQTLCQHMVAHGSDVDPAFSHSFSLLLDHPDFDMERLLRADA